MFLVMFLNFLKFKASCFFKLGSYKKGVKSNVKFSLFFLSFSLTLFFKFSVDGNER